MTSSASNALDELRRQLVTELPGRLDGIRAHLQHLDHSPLIHLIEDDPVQAGHLSQALRDAGYRVQVFTAPTELRAAYTCAELERPAAVVIDMTLSEGNTAGADLLAELKANEARCPPVVFVSVRDDLPARLAAFRAGACRYLVKPVAPGQLTHLLDTLTGRQSAPPYRVLMVDDEPLLLEAQGAILRSAGMEVRTLSQPLQIMAVLQDFAPDVLVLDVDMPDVTGPELAAVLRGSDEQLHLPILFLSTENDLTQQLLALDLGGDDFLLKPVRPDHLVSAVTMRARRAAQDLAIRQRLETTLYEREREHQALNHHAIVSIADRAGNITYVNDKFCETSGYSRGELLGQTHRILKSGEHAPDLYQNLWLTIVSGNVWQGELCNRRKDGSRYWVESTITPFLDGDGKPYQYVSIRTDISALKDVAQRLRVQSHAMEASVNGILIADARKADLPLIYVNPAFERMTGYSSSEVLGRNCRFLQAGDHVQPGLEEIHATLREQRAGSALLRNYRKSGQLFWNELTIAPMRDSNGEVTHFIGISNDITDRVHAKQELERSEAHFRDTLDQAPALIWVADRENKGTWYNRRWFEYTGRTMEQELGFGWIEGMHPDDRERCAKYCQTAFDTHQRFEMEFRLRRADGSFGWVADTGIPRFNAEGALDGYIGYCWDITDRKLAEQAAETLKERLRRGQLFANIGTWEWNIQSGELFWTERIAPLFGYPEGDLETSYDNFLQAIHPDDRLAVTEAVTACIERDAPYEVEHRVVWPDGTVRWLLERGAVVRDTVGKPLQMLGVVQDIHERKEIELALAVSEKRLQEAQSLARLGNWQANIESGELFWSEEIYRIFGQDPSTFKPSVEAFSAAVHPDDRALVSESEKLAEETGVHDVVHRIVRPDGTVRHVHELARADYAASGRVLRLAGTVQDMTDYMEAKEKLRESEERFVFAVEGAGDGIWDWSMLTGEMPLSGHYEAMLGYDKGELVPTIDAWVASVHPDDIVRVQQNLQDYLIGTLPAYVVELRLRCKDGGYKWILCRGTVVARDGENTPVRMIGIHSDISEQKAAQAALVEARETAEQANQAKSNFLSSMSHELRTPMNAILGFAQILEYDTELNTDQQDNVQEILKGGHHLLTLINEVLDLAKIESGRIDLCMEPVNLADLVEDCRHLIQPLAGARQIAMVLDVPKDLTVRADRTRLKQVLLNVLSNAVKYNCEGGDIRLSVQAAVDQRLRILVTDTGPGIPAARLGELFQPFNRLHSGNIEIEGTGIGLTITRRLMELMGGEVSVDSEVGIGSTFRIELLTVPMTTIDSAAAGADIASLPDEPTHQGCVLCIDDNPVNLKLIAQMLSKRRHIHLITAHTPELGVELARVHCPDLILLDINMPGMNGYQVLEVLKADACLKAIPVIAITANAMPRDIERGRAAGFADYLTKPLDIGQFLSTIDRGLSRDNETAT